ncbi:MAG TPA: hypothetical protein PLD12_09510 [Bacteroidales bacterium]|nr:hypothetical protein [Bacteroidales bacterium]HOK99363.1 hypothetical protein [Bacteroidales bacterium]HPO66231.1 hypothetical protein [Bacteroidales bacterium]
MPRNNEKTVFKLISIKHQEKLLYSWIEAVMDVKEAMRYLMGYCAGKRCSYSARILCVYALSYGLRKI